jgi:hypothetical protein
MSRNSKFFKQTLESTALPKGSYAEIGVLVGATFKEICRLARSRNAIAHAFDSFQGMAEPTMKDIEEDGSNPYPCGRFNIGGVRNFIMSMTKYGVSSRQYKCWSGFVPHCFERFPKNEQFCYVRLDLDHYEPTLLAAQWGFSKLVKGGVMSFHDYIPKRKYLAAGAMIKFVTDNSKSLVILGNDEDELFIKKQEK